MNAKTHKNLEAKLLFSAVYFAAFEQIFLREVLSCCFTSLAIFS